MPLGPPLKSSPLQFRETPSLLEPHFAPDFDAWKADPTPATRTRLLKTLQPTIETTVRTHTGATSPLLLGRAKQMTLNALPRYDPTQSKLSTYLISQLKGMRRVNRQQGQIIKVPERMILERQALGQHVESFMDEHGREPSTIELADRMHLSPKRIGMIRSYQPARSTGKMEELAGDTLGGVRAIKGNETRSAWLDLVHGDLGPIDQLIMEHSFGLYGQQKLSNAQIAKKVGVSPGAISQRKMKIQAQLDLESELNPFGG